MSRYTILPHGKSWRVIDTHTGADISFFVNKFDAQRSRRNAERRWNTIKRRYPNLLQMIAPVSETNP